MDSNDILKAVETLLGRRFPGEPVVLDRMPKDFKRPAFTLECERDECTDVNAGLVRRTVTALVTCYGALDAHGNSSRAELNRRMDAVLGLFGAGYLRVGDRAVRVAANKGAGDPDWTEVRAVFTWVDERPGYQDPETPETGGAPLMGEYALNINGKE